MKECGDSLVDGESASVDAGCFVAVELFHVSGCFCFSGKVNAVSGLIHGHTATVDAGCFVGVELFHLVVV